MASRKGVQVRADRRTAELRRALGAELRANRVDQGISQQRLADAVGIDRGHLARIELGAVGASLDHLERVAAGLGGDLSVRFYPGTGSTLRDRDQAAIVEALLRGRAPVWNAMTEVGVYRPARGVIDLVLSRSDGTVVAVEVQSQIRRLEQLLRWANMKRESLPSSDWWRTTGGTPIPPSALLVVRMTEANRRVVAEHEATFRAAFPATTTEAFGSLTTGSPWPGPALLWADITRGAAAIRSTPPRAVDVGRVRLDDGR
jgi:transcriptional regulator with XRE-family HTH domain